MKCRKFQNNIIFYIDGDLTQVLSLEFEKHLEFCIHCKQLFENVSNSYALLESKKITEPKPYFFTRVKAAIANEKQENKLGLLFPSKELVFRWAMYLLIGFFALFTGYFIAKDQSSINQEIIQNQFEKSDEELFADSYYLSISTENLYVLVNGDNEKTNRNDSKE